MTKREAILQSIADLMTASPDLPTASIDEPEPTRWEELAAWPEKPDRKLVHAIAVQDDQTPDVLAFVRGAEDEATDEIEITVVVAYAVQCKPAPGDGAAELRAFRRAQRSKAVRIIADIVTANRNLGIDAETYADLGEPAMDDNVAFPNALPSATALVPVRVLYTGVDAAA